MKPDTYRPCGNYADVYDDLTDAKRKPNDANLEAAKNMCGTCLLTQPEVARDCLRAALSKDERWVLRVLDVHRPPRERDQCGTSGGYSLHTRFGERTCDPCKAAVAATRARQRAERRVA